MMSTNKRRQEIAREIAALRAEADELQNVESEAGPAGYGHKFWLDFRTSIPVDDKGYYHVLPCDMERLLNAGIPLARMKVDMT